MTAKPKGETKMYAYTVDRIAVDKQQFLAAVRETRDVERFTTQDQAAASIVGNMERMALHNVHEVYKYINDIRFGVSFDDR